MFIITFRYLALRHAYNALNTSGTNSFIVDRPMRNSWCKSWNDIPATDYEPNQYPVYLFILFRNNISYMHVYKSSSSRV